MQLILVTLASINVILSIGRYGIRYIMRRKFYWDDLFHGLAVLALVIFVPVTACMLRGLDGLDWLYLMAYLVSFVCCIWFVKFSFLFFLRLLFWTNQRFRAPWKLIAWSTCAAFCALTGWAVVQCVYEKESGSGKILLPG